MLKEITEKEFEKLVLNSNKLVIADFFASWCTPCKMMAQVLIEVAAKYEGKVEIYKINVEENNKLAQEYGVMSIPTLVIFKQGVECETVVGFRQINQVSELIEKYL